jgi:hypothetical protein
MPSAQRSRRFFTTSVAAAAAMTTVPMPVTNSVSMLIEPFTESPPTGTHSVNLTHEPNAWNSLMESARLHRSEQNCHRLGFYPSRHGAGEG